MPNFDPPPAPSTAPLDVVDEPPPSARLDAAESTATPNRPPASQPPSTPGVQRRVDGPFDGVDHSTRKLAEDCAALDGFFAEELSARGELPPADYLGESVRDARGRLAPAPQPSDGSLSARLTKSLAARAFALHGSAAPYASLIVTAALVACAGLLYWLMLGPSGASGLGAEHSNALERDWQRIDAAADAQETSADQAANGSGLPSFSSLAAAAEAQPDSSADTVTALPPDRQGVGPTALPPVTPPARAASATREDAEIGPTLVTPLPAVESVPAYPSTGRASFEFTQVPAASTTSAGSSQPPVEVARRIDQQTESAAATAR